MLGALLAYLIVTAPPTSILRRAITAVCGVLAQFGGVTLAFAFIATLGFGGLVTEPVRRRCSAPRTRASRGSIELPGLILVYTYFQIPLMVIVFLPALEGLRPQWREAAVNLGATTCQYWTRVAFPLLRPAFLGSALLLFANAFAAYATAAALISQGASIMPLLIRSALTSEVVLGQQNLGFALALEMVVVVAIVMARLRAAAAAYREVAAVMAPNAVWRRHPRSGPAAVFAAFFLIPLLALLDFSTRDLAPSDRTGAAWRDAGRRPD